MSENILELGEAYFDALNKKDVQKITEMVHPEMRFKSPVAEESNRDGFLASVRRMLVNVRGLRVKSRFASGNQAMFAYEMSFNEPVGTVKVASLITFEGGQIKSIELFFDARPFEKVMAAHPEAKMAA